MPNCPKCRGYLYQGRNNTLWHTNIPGESVGREADDAICLMTGSLRKERDAARAEVKRLTTVQLHTEIKRLQAYPAAVDKIRSYYPIDVFPNDGNSGAKFARSLCDQIHEEAAEADEEPVE